MYFLVQLNTHLPMLIHILKAFLGHLIHSGDLLLWVGIHCRLSGVNIFFSRTTGPVLTFGMQYL